MSTEIQSRRENLERKVVLKKVFLAILAWLCAVPVYAQTAPSTPPTPCADVEAFGHFDFWLGKWRVAVANGTVAGTNQITKEAGGCLLLERWTSQQGGTGTSLNFFNPESKSWRQVWVGSGGSLIDIAGGLEDGSMVLTGTISYVGREGEFPFRGTWTPLEDGRVRQFFEQYDDTEKAWQPWFEGFYTKIEAE